MSFQKNHIQPALYCVIDIGSYKIRFCAIQIKNGKIHILSYKEKRQESQHFSGWECHDIVALSQVIGEVIHALEQELGLVFEDLVFSYPFWELFVTGKHINMPRKSPAEALTSRELEEILEKSEKMCLSELSTKIEDMYGLNVDHITMILSRVHHFRIDGILPEKIIGQSGENIRLSLLNIFIPKSKYSLLHTIGTALRKNISHILPVEYALTKIFEEENLLCINIGATQTSISLKREGEVVQAWKFAIGMQDLIQKIMKHHDKTRLEIIEELSENTYLVEKKEFLDIWSESMLLCLETLLWGEICPKNIFIGGGGGQNHFVEEYMKGLPYRESEVKMLPSIHFLRVDMTKVLQPMREIELEYISKIPLEMYVLLLELRNALSQEGEIISISLKKAIERLGYLKAAN